MPLVLLFRPIYDPRTRSAPILPWALLFLAAELRRRGVDVAVIDEVCTPDYRAEAAAVLERGPVAVGITTMTCEQIRFGLRFARFVRDRSDAAIVWGGVHPTLRPEETVRHDLVDYVVAGEGERAFADLVERLAKSAPPDVAGVFYSRDGEVVGTRQGGYLDLGALPDIPFDVVDVERYVHRRPDLDIERHFEVCTSRGCPHRCGFCYIESAHGRRWRALDADTTVARIKEVVERFGVDGVSFREDNFFVDQRRVEAIAQRLIDEQVGVKWAGSCRIDYFAKYEPAFVELLRRSGCALLTFGVESGSDRVLELVHKDITVDMAIETAKKVAAAGIRATFHFMAGFPTETTDEVIETCRLIERIRTIAPDAVIREMTVFAPYPGVGLVPLCIERGYREPDDLEEWAEMDWFSAERPWLTREQTRLIESAQFLIARLDHSNPLIRRYVNRRWHHLLNNVAPRPLPELPALRLAKRLIRP